MIETTFDLRYNIAALAIAILRHDVYLPEQAFAALENIEYKTGDYDLDIMLEMRDKGLTYKQIGKIYGTTDSNIHHRLKRYKVKKEKDPSDCSLKRSV